MNNIFQILDISWKHLFTFNKTLVNTIHWYNMSKHSFWYQQDIALFGGVLNNEQLDT